MRIPRPYFIIPSITQWFIRLFTLIWWRSRADLEVYGMEHIRAMSGPILFVSNHTSEWDGPLIRSVMPMFSACTPMFYVSLPKKYYQTADRGPIRRALWGGTFFKLVGAWPVYKGTGDLSKALVHHLAVLEQGGSITIFPEGRLSKDGSINDFKIGASFLAATKKVQIVPVAITGIGKRIVPEGRSRPRVTVEFGTPIRYPDTLGTSEEELHQFATTTRRIVVSLARKYSPFVQES